MFSGHYGSGKTNIAVNFAQMLRKTHEKVAICDLDIINPYFRTKDSADLFERQGIRLIASLYANTNVDVPALPAEAYSVIDDRDTFAVLDVGGDDTGALALGRYKDAILRENNFAHLFVVNRFRPLTRTPEEAAAIRLEIESAGGVPFTGIVNNSNLGAETTCETVLSSLAYAEEISRLTGLEIAFTALKASLCTEVKPYVNTPLFPMTLQAWRPGTAAVEKG